jgi:hypothetical protein
VYADSDRIKNVQILYGKREEKRPFGRTRRRKDSTKIAVADV